MMKSTIELGRYLEPSFPIVHVHIARRRGSVHHVLALTPYATQSFVEDLARTGHDTAVEVTLPADVPDAFAARTEREFARLRPHGVEVMIRHADDGREAPLSAPASPSLSRGVAELAVLMGRLLHEFQSERAITAAHLIDHDGPSRGHLQAQWGATDGVLSAWGSTLAASADSLPPLVQMHADAVRSLVTQLDATRDEVQDRAREVTEAVEYYTQLSRALLATADGLVAASDTALVATAHLAFLHAKEEAALEQVEVASTALPQNLAHCVAARVASREAYLRTFATTAPEPVLSEYRALMAEPACCEATGLERAMIDHTACLDEPLDTDNWCRSLGNIVERFRDLETHSAATLLQSAM